MMTLVAGVALLFIWPWEEPGIEMVKLSVPKDCADTLVKLHNDLHKSDRAVLVWRIDNECPQPMEVSLTPKTSGFSCVGEPTTANLGTPFQMKGKERAYVICAIDYPADSVFTPKPYPFAFRFRLLPAQDSTIWPKGSEIAIEVEP